MAPEGGSGPPPPRDDLLEHLKWTAPVRERLSQAERRETRSCLLLGCLVVAAMVAVAGIVGLVRQFHQPSMVLPARVGDLPRIDSAPLDARLTQLIQAIEQDEVRATQANGAYYGNDPQRPEVMLVLLRAPHTDAEVTGIRTSMEAPVTGNPSTPDGPHTVSATVDGVDFVCEPIIENGDNGPVGERTDCTWDDHGDGIGVLVDFHSGESTVILKEVEAVQPGAIG